MERWEAISAVRRMQDYMEANLTRPLTLSELARVAGYSQWHAGRVFKELAGKTPFEYLRALRLNKAAIYIREKKPRIVDVAFDFVFDSHEGFTRAFQKEFGTTPKKYSNESGSVEPFMPDRIRDYYLKLQKGELNMTEKERPNTVFVQVVERPQRNVIIKRGIKANHYFEYCEEVGCDVWETLTGIKEALYEPAGMWLPANLIKTGTSSYVQGVEVPVGFSGEVPAGFEMIDLPPCKMMVFQGEPFDDKDFGKAIEELWEIMKSYDPRVYGFEWADEDAPRFQLEPQGYRGYIEARPVRQINKA